MAPSTFYLVNHTHTDFGYTDYPGTLYRMHRSIIDRAMDVVEAHAHLPDEARFRWTCEVAEITLDWLRHAPPSQVDRFRRLHDQGLIGVAGMAVHWTPLVSPALAERSLDRLRLLRQDYGLTVRTAWQCDVNGLSWPWTDLLLDAGIGSLVLASNPHRGMPDAAAPRLFNWHSPTGRILPTLHGWHYTYGSVGLRFSEQSTQEAQVCVDRFLARPGGSSAWPHEGLIVQVTNRASLDNGFPTDTLSDFVQRWNAEGRTPRLEIRTLDQAMDAVLAKAGPVPGLSGDWPDYWADGVASTAFETAIARAGERILPVTDLLTALQGQPDDPAQEVAVQSLSMYDEHTWGAYASVTLPNSPFTRFQQSWKLHQAHDGFASALEAASRAARNRARGLAGGPVENDAHIRAGQDPAIPIEAQSYYVFNPSATPRRIRWPVPCDYGGASPASILHGWLTEEFMPGMNVQRQKRMPSSTHVLDVTLPPFAEAIIRPVPADPARLGLAGTDWIETDLWRLEMNPKTGALQRLTNRQTGLDFGLGAQGFGQVLYEDLADPDRGRAAIFGRGNGVNDWNRPETLAWPEVPTRFRRFPAESARLGSARQTLLGPEIDQHLSWPNGDTAVLTWRLPLAGPGIDLCVSFTKTRVTAPESFFVVFSLNGTNPTVDLDIGDLTIDAEEVLPEACQTWSSVQRQASLATDLASLVVASPDAPLVHPFGPQTEGAGKRIARDAALGFWVMNNHWDVNFAASQSGNIPFRFHLLPCQGHDRAAAAAFAQAATTPPVIVRTQAAAPRPAALVADLQSEQPLELRLRSVGPGKVMASIVNRGDQDTAFTLGLAGLAPQRATLVSAAGEAMSGSPPGLSKGKVNAKAAARSTLRLLLEI